VGAARDALDERVVRVETARARTDLEPVRRERERTEPLPAHADEQVRLDEARGDGGDDEDGDESRQQAAGAALPEVGKVEVPGAAHLPHLQGGDEEPADDEEDVDAEEASHDASGHRW